MINTEHSQTNQLLYPSVVLGLSIGSMSGLFESALVSLTGLNLSWTYIAYLFWFDVLVGGLYGYLGYIIFRSITNRTSILKRFKRDAILIGTVVLITVTVQIAIFLFSVWQSMSLAGLKTISAWIFITLLLLCSFSKLLRLKGEKEYLQSMVPLLTGLFLLQAFFYGGFYLNTSFLAQTSILTRIIVNASIAIILLSLFLIFQWMLKRFSWGKSQIFTHIYRTAVWMVPISFMVSLFLFFGVQVRFAYNPKSNVNPAAVETKKGSTETRPNVILISIDTLRADRLGYNGYKRSITPNIDRLAREGTVFKYAVSQSPWTLPSHASIMTSLYPSQHGASQVTSKLDKNFVTLAEQLRDASYETAAFAGGGWISPSFGLDQGFDFFDPYAEHNLHLRYVPTAARLKFPLFEEKVCFSFAVPRIIRWLQANATHNTPFFLFIHTYEVHNYFLNDKKLHPYLNKIGFQHREKLPDFTKGPHPRFVNNIIQWLLTAEEKKLEYFQALYDAEILFTDHLINDILNELNSLGLMNKTLIILTSDHGEGFNKALKRIHHGGRLHNDQLLVPLILRLPGVFPENKVIDVQVQLIDILPTILDVLNLQQPKEINGASFLKYVSASGIKNGHPAFSEELGFKINETNFREAIGDHYRMVSVISDGIKVIHSPDKDEMYDLKNDPEEINNLVEQKSSLNKRVEITLDKFVSDFKPIYTQRERPLKAKKGELAETMEKLKSLGYLK
jgi:arylsulfatase A-like enzyme